MEIFLDTAIVDEIRECVKYGLLDGVTTNPSLIAQSGRKQEDVIAEICAMGLGSVSAEVISTEMDGMIAEGRKLAKISPAVTVKIPMTRDGIGATKVLASEGTRVNVTLVFQPVQAMLAARAGAAYVSPFLGRLDDIGQDGIGLIREIREIFDNYQFKTKILAASIRHSYHMRECALAGADVGTLPAKVLWQLFKHPLTDSGLAQFLADHAKSTKG